MDSHLTQEKTSLSRFTSQEAAGARLKDSRWGLVFIILGIVGLVVWSMGAEMVFNYMVAYVYGRDPGEPIWFMAPYYSMLVLIPLSLVIVGACVVLFSRVPEAGNE